MPNKLVFITGNRHKVEEMRGILKDTGITLETVSLDLPEIQGTSQDIAREKCLQGAEKVGGPVLVEDSALEMKALNGLPGPYVKAFVDAVGNEGLCKLLIPYEDKTAEAVCTFGYSAGPGSKPVIFQGRLVGRIVSERGDSAFGWEPIFEFEGETLAEMSPDKKNSLSHRFRGLRKFREWLNSDKVVP